MKEGFVYKRVPHITLKSIANNEQIDIIHAKWEEKLSPILNELNTILKQSWREWEVPKEPEKDWPETASNLLKSWWDMRKARQKEIDEAITKAADYETLYDQPYVDDRKVRVSGPFTVESLSPHRNLDSNEEVSESMYITKDDLRNQFEATIIDNLKKSGVQNTVRNERLKFSRLDPYASVWIHAEGEYLEDDKHRRVGICIGPEYGTVSSYIIQKAAEEAIGVGCFDILIICGFAFDPNAYEEAKRYDNLTILLARINAELLMGNELLKNTGSGNLFTVFGEPDISIEVDENNLVTVELKGLDIYDPTTGEVRASSVDDIACWFIDTNYNSKVFFPRRTYFLGLDKPYEKLSKALNAEIDKEVWEQLYQTKSRPFVKPRSGKIAIKVINYYGDEILRVFSI